MAGLLIIFTKGVDRNQITITYAVLLCSKAHVITPTINDLVQSKKEFIHLKVYQLTFFSIRPKFLIMQIKHIHEISFETKISLMV